MKVVIIGPAYPLRGGLAEFNERIAVQLQKEGHEVKMFTFSLQYPNFLFPGKTQYSPDPAPADLDIEVCINSVNPFNWWTVGNRIRKMKVDLVICRFWLPFMGPCLGTILRIIKRNKSTKILSLIDNIIPHEKRIGDTFFAQYFTKAVDSFVVMSRAVEEDLKKFTKPQQAIAYVPHPVYDTYGQQYSKAVACEKLGLDPQQKYLLFFGFIRHYKGLDLLLEAMADPAIKAANIRLIIAGEFYADRAKYDAIISKNKLEKQLILQTEFIPKAEVGYYFGAADMIVQPYKTATQSGISQMAFHFEKPMLVTNVGGLPEIVPHGKAGYVVEPNPTIIATSILDFYQNDRAAEFTKGVIERKAFYSWSNLTKVF